MPITSALPRRQPLESSHKSHESISMASFVPTHSNSPERVINATDTPLGKLVGETYRAGDARTLAQLAMGNVPPPFVEPLAAHLEASRDEVDGGFEVLDWMKEAARHRMGKLIPNAVHQALQFEPSLQRPNTHPSTTAYIPPEEQGVAPAIENSRILELNLYPGSSDPTDKRPTSIELNLTPYIGNYVFLGLRTGGGDAVVGRHRAAE